MNRTELKAKAKELLKPQFITVLLTVVITGILVGILNSMSATETLSQFKLNGSDVITLSILTPPSGTALIGTIIGLLVAGPLAVGAMLVYTTVTAGKTAQLEQIFNPFKTNFISCFLANLLVDLIVALFSLLLVIPGIMRAYSYAMVSYVLCKEPECSAMEALARSKSMMKGHRMELFKLHLSFIGWFLLCIVTFGLALLWVGPYTEITQTLFFDKIYNEAN